MSDLNTGWRWTFHYKLTRTIVSLNWSLGPNLKPVTDNDGHIIGFDIVITTLYDEAPEEDSNNRVRTIVQKLSARSEQAISYRLLGYEGKSNDPSQLGRVASFTTHVYNIEGAPLRINNIDLTDTNIEGILASNNTCNRLQHLIDAITHFCSARYRECITAGFLAIEGNTTLCCYQKYHCIRNIVNHEEDQIWHHHTATDFDYYFGPSVFDFEVPYNKTHRIIILDFESNKTIHMLKIISQDLITSAKSFLNV